MLSEAIETKVALVLALLLHARHASTHGVLKVCVTVLFLLVLQQFVTFASPMGAIDATVPAVLVKLAALAVIHALVAHGALLACQFKPLFFCVAALGAHLRDLCVECLEFACHAVSDSANIVAGAASAPTGLFRLQCFLELDLPGKQCVIFFLV